MTPQQETKFRDIISVLTKCDRDIGDRDDDTKLEKLQDYLIRLLSQANWPSRSKKRRAAADRRLVNPTVRLKALELRRAGKSWKEIGRHLGKSAQVANTYADIALADYYRRQYGVDYEAERKKLWPPRRDIKAERAAKEKAENMEKLRVLFASQAAGLALEDYIENCKSQAASLAAFPLRGLA